MEREPANIPEGYTEAQIEAYELGWISGYNQARIDGKLLTAPVVEDAAVDVRLAALHDRMSEVTNRRHAQMQQQETDRRVSDDLADGLLRKHAAGRAEMMAQIRAASDRRAERDRLEQRQMRGEV